jgi:hypothetical protein
MSTTNPTTQTNNSAKTKWTVLFIVHAVDEQSRFYSEQLFTKLLQAKSSPNVRVFVLRNTYDYANDGTTHAHLFEIASENALPKVKRIYPEGFDAKHGPQDRKSFGSMYLDAPLNPNLGNQTTLQAILNTVKTYVRKDMDEKDEDPNVMLFTWDHGCAFGIFDSEEYDIDTARPIKSAPSTDMLMIKELAPAIQNSFGKVQLLVMMNCWMQSIETNDQLAIKNDKGEGIVDILIAPETSIDWLGYNYISIINELIDKYANDNPDLNSLAAFIIESTKEMYKRIDGTSAIKLDELDLCATRPLSPLLVKLKTQIKQLAISLIKNLNSEIYGITSARAAVNELTEEFGGGGRPWCFVDILQFAKNLKEKGVKFDFNIDDFITELNYNLRPDPNDKETFMVFRKPATKSNLGEPIELGGLSICFPNNLAFIQSSFYQRFYASNFENFQARISFVQNVRDWPKLIEEALTKGKIKPNPRSGKNYTLNFEHTVKIKSVDEIVVISTMDPIKTENTDWIKVNANDKDLPLRDFTIGCKIDLNVNGREIRIDSLMPSLNDITGQLRAISVARGAGGNKTGAGGNKTGAGGNKTGAGELIQPRALEDVG